MSTNAPALEVDYASMVPRRVIFANADGSFGKVDDEVEEPTVTTARVPNRWFSSPDLTVNPVVSYAEEIAEGMEPLIANPPTAENLIDPTESPFNVTEFENAVDGLMPSYNFSRNSTTNTPLASDIPLIDMLATHEGALVVLIFLLMGKLIFLK